MVGRNEIERGGVLLEELDILCQVHGNPQSMRLKRQILSFSSQEKIHHQDSFCVKINGI